MSKITMNDIAKLANVSQPTVSRVINGHEGVKPDVVEKVLQVIEEVGYIPNQAARTLKRSDTKIIGVCVTEIYNPYFVELIDILELELRRRGYNMLFHSSKHNPITEWENIQNFIARQVDGIIIVPTSDFNLPKIAQLQTPTVIITQNHPELDSIGLDHLKAGQIAGEYFVHQGHQTFGYIGSQADDKFAGYEHALRENGFPFNHDCFIPITNNSTNHLTVRNCIDAYLDQQQTVKFTSIFAVNDMMAIEFIRAANARHIKVPEEIAVVGFDDTYLSKILEISSIHQPIQEMVHTAVEVLLNRVGQQQQTNLVNLHLEPTLIERSSSKK